MSAAVPTSKLVAISLAGLILLCGCPRKAQPRPQAQPPEAPTADGRTSPPGGTPIPPAPRPVSPCLTNLPERKGPLPSWGHGADASGKAGVVTSVDASATQAGVAILEAGGNAVDAAIATAFALAVTHPSAGNIGGGGFMTLKIGPAVETIDFREDSPKKLTDEAFWKMIRSGGRGAASVGVPGTVAGLHMAHERHGKLSWAELLQPALDLARHGYPLGDRQAQTVVWAESDLRRDAIARSVFFKDEKPAAPGTIIKRPRLEVALRRIADEGPKGFYEGPTALDIVESLGQEGLLTRADLQGYRAKVREPLCYDFQGVRVIAPPAPSAGGVALTQALLILNESGIEKTQPDSAHRLHLFAEASRRAQAERQLFVVAPEALTAAEKTAQAARALDPQTWLKVHPINPEKATPSSDLDSSYAKVLAEQEHTTHLSVIDAEGGLVSLTVTLSGSYGSRIFTKKTGIVLNNSTASFASVGVNTPQAGRRTTSSMAPTLALLGKSGALVLGSPGGDTIPSTVGQLMLHLLVDDKNLKEAVVAPRVHQTFAPGSLTTEKAHPLSPEIRRQLEKRGHRIEARRSAIGDANIAARLGETSFAVCDDREGGAAIAAKSNETKVSPPHR